MGRKIAFALSLLVLIVTGVLGIYNGIAEWRGGSTAVMAYGGRDATVGRALTASAASALIAAGIISAAKVFTRTRQPD